MFDFIIKHLPWFWFGIAVVCTAIEAVTFGLTTIWFAAGALVMIFISFTPLPFAWQLLVFFILSGVLLGFTRPLAVKKLKVGKEKTNSESLIGKKALVVKRISEFEKGEVTVSGTVWTAQSADGSVLEEKTECVIDKIAGVTLVVKPVQE
ncbi:NfeD family protein [Treponema brennaborense]|uniref:NfeD-like C-terminal domain-containing protein n=1 Tax=Treponema brennaborense (strain DSM 12168 / CIP 105900 / DD5/3) TaxID=906968 RepID=F4LJ03_TREBD|nr:NfeD family protein [Treponema brennaborense]AEE17312.1 protein of unknown function DUF107 [Treponema brennaborense DSM 12168]